MRKLAFALLVVLGLHSGCSLLIGDSLRSLTAISPPLVDGVSVMVETVATGPFGLGYFQRRAVLLRDGGRTATFWLTAGENNTRDVDVFQTGSRELFFVQRTMSRRVDLAAGTSEAYPLFPCGMARPPGGSYLGSFDYAGKGQFRFFPADSPAGGGMEQETEMQTEDDCRTRLQWWREKRG
jgi:hypothetical protein